MHFLFITGGIIIDLIFQSILNVGKQTSNVSYLYDQFFCYYIISKQSMMRNWFYYYEIFHDFLLALAEYYIELC